MEKRAITGECGMKIWIPAAIFIFFLIPGIIRSDRLLGRIPDSYLLSPAFFAALLIAVDASGRYDRFCTGTVLLIIEFLIYSLSRGRLMGGGDMKLILFWGVILGSSGILQGLLCSLLLAAAVEGGIRRRRVFPLAPYLCLGMGLAFLWQELPV